MTQQNLSSIDSHDWYRFLMWGGCIKWCTNLITHHVLWNKLSNLQLHAFLLILLLKQTMGLMYPKMSQLFMGMLYKAFMHFWTWYHIYTPIWPCYEKGVVLPNDIFWFVEGHDPFPWMSIPHPTPLFVCKLTLEHSQKISTSPMSLDSTFEFPKVLEESTWAWHDTFQQLFAKMQRIKQHANQV